MAEELESNVRSLSAEKHAALAEQNGWPLTFAEGYVAGQMQRRIGKSLVSYMKVGIDQYALGFRAGYFGRAGESNRVSGISDVLATPTTSGSAQ